MVFPRVLLIHCLPVCYDPISCQQDKQILGIKANLLRFLIDKAVRKILFPTADLILTFKNQNTFRFQYPIGFMHSLHVKLVQTCFIWEYSKSAVNLIAVAY